MDWPAGHPLERIGRLSKAESLMFRGPDTDRLRRLMDLRGKRIGIGPIGLSLLFNAMALWHRFRLWRIDAHRVRANGTISLLFGAWVTVGEISEMPASAQHRAKLRYALRAFRNRRDR